MSDVASTKAALAKGALLILAGIADALNTVLGAIPTEFSRATILVGFIIGIVTLQKIRQDKRNAQKKADLEETQALLDMQNAEIEKSIKEEQLQALIDAREHRRRQGDPHPERNQ